MNQMTVTILNLVIDSFGYKRYTCAATYIDGQVTETRIYYYPANSLYGAWRKVNRTGRSGHKVINTVKSTYRAFAAFYWQWEFENPVSYTWRGVGPFPARAAFPLEA